VPCPAGFNLLLRALKGARTDGTDDFFLSREYANVANKSRFAPDFFEFYLSVSHPRHSRIRG
jgi:hypothetical protein